MPKKQCLWPADGSSPCVVIPKIAKVDKYKGAAGHRILVYFGPIVDNGCDAWFEYPTQSERDSAYDSLISAIRAWWEE